MHEVYLNRLFFVLRQSDFKIIERQKTQRNEGTVSDT